MKPFVLVLLVAVGGVGLGGASVAGVTATVTDTCSAEEHAAWDEAGAPFSAIQGNVPNAQDDFIIHEPSGQPSGRYCARDTRVHPFNDPDGPAVGVAQEASGWGEEAVKETVTPFMRMVGKSITARYAGAMPQYKCLGGIPCPLPAPLAKSSGFQLRLSAGGGLQPAGSYAFLEYRRAAGDPDKLSIPFVVLSAHKGDWLEFSLRGEVFWKAELVNLNANELYEVSVPNTSPKHGLVVLGLYLNAEVASDSVVYVPTALEP
jgi:hypothetical protein